MPDFLDSLFPTKADCGCPGRWIDTAGRPHCLHCDPPPLPCAVLRKEIRCGDGWEPWPTDDQPKPSWDPFSGDPPPKGVYFPIGDPYRVQRALERPQTICRCAQTKLIETPCRGGAWVRVACERCGYVVEIRDAIA